MTAFASTLWWLLAGMAAVTELLTGTFYLLMLCIGLVAAALAAHAGLSITWQIVICAVVSAGTVTGLWFVRRRRPGDPSARAERSVNLDVGEIVQIESWLADGTATVKYRGAQWTAIHRDGCVPMPGPHRVVELVGSRLLVEPARAS